MKTNSIVPSTSNDNNIRGSLIDLRNQRKNKFNEVNSESESSSDVDELSDDLNIENATILTTNKRKLSTYQRQSKHDLLNNNNSLRPSRKFSTTNTEQLGSIVKNSEYLRSSLGNINHNNNNILNDNNYHKKSFNRNSFQYNNNINNNNNQRNSIIVNNPTSHHNHQHIKPSVIEKVTRAFQRNANDMWAIFNPPKSAKQILKEAEADKQYKKLKRNSRIIIQIRRDSPTILPKLLIHPDTFWRAWWDIMMLFLVIYYAIVTPINIFFDSSPFDILVLEILFNSFFVIDIVLQFFTSFKHTTGPNAGRLEASHRVVVIKYLKSWFIIDLVASIPIDLIVGIRKGESSGFTINRLLKLLRSVKLMRILRMSRLWKRMLLRAKINPSVVRLAKLFGFLLVEWHWIGCLYWGIAIAEGFKPNGEYETWTPLPNVLNMSFGSQYLRGFFLGNYGNNRCW